MVDESVTFFRKRKIAEIKSCLPEFCDAYFEYIDSKTLGTKFVYLTLINSFFEYVHDNFYSGKPVKCYTADDFFDTVTEDVISGFLRTLEDSPSFTDPTIEHNSTAKKAMSIIRRFFSFYLKSGVILKDPSATLDNKNRTNRVFIQTLDDDEIEKMIESSHVVWNKTRSKALRNEIIIKLMLHYGLKTNDIQNFQLQDFNFAEKTLRILRTAGIYYILMAETDANLIQTYIEQYRRKKLEDDEEKNLPLFISSQNKNLSERSVQLILMEISENAGITFPVSQKNLYGTFSQKYYDATGDTDIIKIIMDIDSDPYDRFIIRKNRVVLDIKDKAF
jgi:integrase/recombinase XerC